MKAILFDLDGTLIQLDMEPFLREYINSISEYCACFSPPQLFAKYLWEATEKMLRNDGRHSNEEEFMKHFIPAIGQDRETVYKRLEKYYTQEFCKLKTLARKKDTAPLILKDAMDKGWAVILATNPLFPMLAIEERMRWAGIKDYPWLHITAYENSSSCKPNLMYYQEIADKFNLEPQQCWMVGNDAQEDMEAGRLGFNTYLVTDHLIDKGHDYPQPRGRGTLEEFRHFVKEKL